MLEPIERYRNAIALIDDENRQDPHEEEWLGTSYPKELLYSMRMTEVLDQFAPNAAESLKLAARAQHICRWKINRDAYPMDRHGYLKWRNQLKSMHAEITKGILQKVGYDDEFNNEVCLLIEKKQLKQNPDTQTLEDVICLVFLQYYIDDFSRTKSEEKMVEILSKTWRKMSTRGQEEAMKLDLSEETLDLVKKAMSL